MQSSLIILTLSIAAVSCGIFSVKDPGTTMQKCAESTGAEPPKAFEKIQGGKCSEMNDEEKAFLVCTAKDMGAVKNGQVNKGILPLCSMAMKGSAADKKAATKCFGNIKAPSDEEAIYEGCECFHTHMVKN